MTPIARARFTSVPRERRHAWRRALTLALAAIVLAPASSYAQGGGSPWENAVTVADDQFHGPHRPGAEPGLDCRRRRDVRLRGRGARNDSWPGLCLASGWRSAP